MFATNLEGRWTAKTGSKRSRNAARRHPGQYALTFLACQSLASQPTLGRRHRRTCAQLYTTRMVVHYTMYASGAVFVRVSP